MCKGWVSVQYTLGGVYLCARYIVRDDELVEGAFKHSSAKTKRELVDRGCPFGLTGTIYQEVLQGVSMSEEFERISEYLGSQLFYHPQHPVISCGEAARMYFDCCREGITIRSATDCLIARIAIEHDLMLLHDRDFEKMAAVFPELTLARAPRDLAKDGKRSDPL